jgi:hypothetical protein
MGRWKRGGVIFWCWQGDHPPRHVHIFEDGQDIVKFDIDHWVLMQGNLTAKMRKALESLKDEGVFDEGSQV